VLKLLAEVKKGQKKDPEDKRGRPAVPTWVKGFTQLKKGIAMATSEAVTAGDFATYSPDDAQDLLDAVEPQLAALQKLVDDVKAAMASWKSSTG
jgi:hypothetical protein